MTLDLSLLPDGGTRWLDASGDHATVVLSTRAALGKRIAKLVGGSMATTAPADANVVAIVPHPAELFSASLRRPGAGSPVRFVLAPGFASRLMTQPRLARFRYSVP